MVPFATTPMVLIPLTPIHVGGGDEVQLQPEDYRLRDGVVERLSTRAILARLGEAERQRWLADMARDMASAIRNLQGKAEAADILERIAIAPASARELDPSNRSRRNQIDAFFRTGGCPVLPGSSLKGLLRTAWLAHCAAHFGAPRSKDARHLAEELFALAPGKSAQDTDPFRDVAVIDAPLPEGATRIDPVQTWKRSPPRGRAARTYGFESLGQMHRERTRSVADGGAPPVIALEIGLRRHRGGDPQKRPRPERIPDDIPALLAALEAHHAPLWHHEVEEKFFAGDPGTRLRAALNLFNGLSRSGADPDAALVRLGWASHAEAKSLPQVRRIERPQAKGPGRFATEGSARHVINLNGQPLPFGWALLIRADRWQAPTRWLDPVAQAPIPSSGGAASPQATSALGQQLRFAKGQQVWVDGEKGTLLDDVTQGAMDSNEVRLRYDGESGWEIIKIKDIERLA